MDDYSARPTLDRETSMPIRIETSLVRVERHLRGREKEIRLTQVRPRPNVLGGAPGTDCPELAIDLSGVMTLLSATSSVAVIAGALFIVFQLRQNGKLIEATVRQNRSNVSIALIERITDESFARRRKQMYDVVKKFAPRNWEGFEGTLEDFEVRNFAYLYELMGQLAREGIIDLSTLKNALQYLVVFDWQTFAPIAKYLMESYKITVNPWGSFEWLAEETRRQMQERESLAQTRQ